LVAGLKGGEGFEIRCELGGGGGKGGIREMSSYCFAIQLMRFGVRTPGLYIYTVDSAYITRSD
jgi:hypothetical protein